VLLCFELATMHRKAEPEKIAPTCEFGACRRPKPKVTFYAPVWGSVQLNGIPTRLLSPVDFGPSARMGMTRVPAQAEPAPLWLAQLAKIWVARS